MCGQTISCVSDGVSKLGDGVLMMVVRLILTLDVNHHCRVVLAICSPGVVARAALQLDIRLHLFNRLRCVTSLQYTHLPGLSWEDSYVRVFCRPMY